MKKIRLWAGVALWVAGGLLMGGCSSPSYLVLLPDADGSVGKVTLQGTAGQQVLSVAQHGALLDGSKAPAPVSNEALERDFGTAMRARPALPEVFILYFQSQGTDLTPQSQALLPYIVEHIMKRKAVDLSVIGHADTLGQDEINNRLALHRAREVVRQLREMGLNRAIPMVVESYGKRMLRIPTPDGVSEPRNRRVEITVR